MSRQVEFRTLSESLCKVATPIGTMFTGAVNSTYQEGTNTVTFSPADQSMAFKIEVANNGLRVKDSSEHATIDYTTQPFDKMWEWESQGHTLYRSWFGQVKGTLSGNSFTGIAGTDVFFGPDPYLETVFFKESNYEWIIYLDNRPDGTTKYGVILTTNTGIAGGMEGVKPGKPRLIKPPEKPTLSWADCGVPSKLVVEPFGSFTSVSLVAGQPLGWINWVEIQPDPPEPSFFGWLEHVRVK